SACSCFPSCHLPRHADDLGVLAGEDGGNSVVDVFSLAARDLLEALSGEGAEMPFYAGLHFLFAGGLASCDGQLDLLRRGLEDRQAVSFGDARDSPPAHRHLGCAAGATRKAHALRADRDRAPVVDPPGDLFGDCSSSLEVVVGGSDMAFLARRCCADDGHALDEDAVGLDARGADANARESRIDAEDEDAHRRTSCLALVEAIPISSCSLASRIRRSAMA